MERTVALKKLEKLLGQKLGYRVDPKAPSSDERTSAKAALLMAIEKRNKLNEQREARYQAILQADAEYQNLNAAAVAARKFVSELQSITGHYKITVGTSNGLFFSVKAQGDSWEAIIAKLTKKEPPKAPDPIPPEDRKVASALLTALNKGMREFL